MSTPTLVNARTNTHKGNLKSISAMLVAVGFFAVMDAVLKVLSTRYPALQVAALRGWVALPLIALWIQSRGTWHTVWRIRWPLHLLRGVLAIGMLAFFTTGLKELPIATAYTLFFIAPILITLLSAPVLGERVPSAHWWAVAGGMAGVLVALRPGVDGIVSWAGRAGRGGVLRRGSGGGTPIQPHRFQRKPDAVDHGHGGLGRHGACRTSLGASSAR